MTESKNRLRGDIGIAATQNVVVVAIGVATAVIIARMLGPSGNGQFGIAILLPTMLALLANFGVSSANAYFIASGRVTAAVARRATLRIWFGLSIIGLIVALITVRWGASLFPGVSPGWLLLALAAFPFALLTALMSSLLHGLQDFPRLYAALVAGPAFTLAFVALFLVGFGMGSGGAIAGYVLGQLAGSAVLLFLLRAHDLAGGEKDDRRAWRDYVRRCLEFGWKAHAGTVITYLNYRTDLLLVNLLMSPTDTGIYLVAVQIAERLWIPAQAASGVIMPRLSGSYARLGDDAALTARVARWVFAASILGAVALALVAHLLIYVLFGDAFLPAERALVWLLPGIIVASLSKVLASDITARGRPELNLVTALVIIMTNIAGNLLLIPRLGIVGAAMASTAAYFIGTLLQIVIYVRLGDRPWWELFIWDRGDWLLLRDLLPWRRGKADAGQ